MLNRRLLLTTVSGILSGEMDRTNFMNGIDQPKNFTSPIKQSTDEAAHALGRGDMRSASSFGLVPEADIDNAPALREALNFLESVNSSTSGTIWFSDGIYNFKTAVGKLPRSICMRGSFVSSVVFNYRPDPERSAPLFIVDKPNAEFENIQFTHAQAQTVPLIDILKLGSCKITRCGLQDFPIGLRSSGVLRVRDTEFNSGAFEKTEEGSVGIMIDGGQLFAEQIRFNTSNKKNVPVIGVQVNSAQEVWIAQSSFSNIKDAIVVTPQANQTVFDVVIELAKINNISGDGVRIAPERAASVRIVRVISPEVISARGDGFLLAGQGSINHLELIGGRLTGCGGNGLAIQNASSFKVIGTIFHDNLKDGIKVSGPLSRWLISGVTSGSLAGTPGNGGFGINITEAGSNNFLIANCDLIGNKKGSIQNASSHSAGFISGLIID